ncbi:regulator of microtubule dynamics protein 1 [Orussus abietinus]|uniref:regulator of microtubule dynamics protein 1 n=1 Tax=Orussus abietinus TaxID=222816 RepID=UPI0006253EFE|nr:regulator of microtubule dynamics protein 1 [Orussus abietinus]XP_012286604.1 regulator of microtubule dynamics protein 1 [Orussus abietinus]XP_012286605.1 regulator of microtubule dynamics protein 1 [Orussus abietinus]
MSFIYNMELQRFLCFVRIIKISLKRVMYRSNKIPLKETCHGMLTRSMPLTIPFTFMGVWGLLQKDGEKAVTVTAKDLLLTKADTLFEHGKYQEVYDLLNKYRDEQDVEILWRLSRCLYKMSKTKKDYEAKKLIYEGYELISLALSIKEDHYAVHKWVCVLLDSKSSYEGMKERIKQLNTVKNHMLRAIELNPNDSTTLYMLGNWCFQVTSLSWYQRKLASALFGEPPTSSYEEALMYFKRAEEISPQFYSQNLLMLAKTYLKLKREEEAHKYLKLAAEYPVKCSDDHEAKQEARKLMSGYESA